MSVVHCLLLTCACLRSVPWPAPHGNASKRFTAAGLPNPRVPLGATNPEQRVAAARRSSQLAAQRSVSQRSAAARSATQRQRRVRHGARSAVQSFVLTAQRPWKRCTDQDSCISPIGRPGVQTAAKPRQPPPQPPADQHQPHGPIQCCSTLLNNHNQFVELNECTSRTSRSSTPPLPW